MILNVLRAKIHTVRVTEANINYRGSITIDQDLLDASGIHEYEVVHINNATNGNRMITYVISGKRGSGEILMNGAAALKADVGDVIHILAFGDIDEKEMATFKPKVIHTDENNKLVEE